MLLQSLINPLIVVLIGLGPCSLIIWVMVSIRKRTTLRRKNPINTHLLRSPGQSLLDEAEDTSIDLFSYLLITPFISLYFYASYLSSNKTNILLILFGISLVIALLFIGNKIIKLSNKREKLRLGYDAELAVGQELNLLMRHGFYVFHDVNLKNTLSEFNIDHVVVGKTGVFAVETKGRSKPTDKTGKDSSKVNFDGNKLVFPQWEEDKPIEQAKRQAVTLGKWLTSAVGEPIGVKAVIALPGWFTNSTSKKTDVAVINGKNPDKFFNVIREVDLSDKQIKQIAHQLESLCRNIEPRAFTMPK
jgi:hypothetical protein